MAWQLRTLVVLTEDLSSVLNSRSRQSDAFLSFFAGAWRVCIYIHADKT